MNTRLLIIFGLVLQLLMVSAPTRCAASQCELAPSTASSSSGCGGCCEGPAPSDERQTPEPSPCEACPLCSEINSEPNGLAVRSLEPAPRPFTKPVALRWSILREHDLDIRSREAWRHELPPPDLTRTSPPDLCRWLT
ncbi:MAG: hypothetical protein Tsb0013_03690 [Phycisphaerales bacterium]